MDRSCYGPVGIQSGIVCSPAKVVVDSPTLREWKPIKPLH